MRNNNSLIFFFFSFCSELIAIINVPVKMGPAFKLRPGVGYHFSIVSFFDSITKYQPFLFCGQMGTFTRTEKEMIFF